MHLSVNPFSATHEPGDHRGRKDLKCKCTSWLPGPGGPWLVPAYWWIGANTLEGGLQNGACQHQCPCVRTSSPNGFFQPASISLRWVVRGPSCLLSPASPGNPLRSKSGLKPGSFQITVSELGLKSVQNFVDAL